MMKISKREALLVTVLFLLVVGYLTYIFIYTPKKAKLAELTMQLQESRDSIVAAKVKIEAIPQLEEEIAVEAAAAHNGAPMFFNSIVQQNLIVLLSEMASEASFNIDTYNFSMPVVDNISPIVPGGSELSFYLKQLVDRYTERYEITGQAEEPKGDNPGADSSIASDESNQLAKSSVNISFTGSYNELIKYLKVLEDYEKEIIVSNINITGQNGDQLNGSMTLDFYVLPKLFPNETDFAYLEWKYDLKRGKAHPFNENVPAPQNYLQSELAQGQQVSSGEQPISYRDPDFFMIARPSATNMPTMTIGAGGDTSGETYIRSASEGQENVTVELTAANGGYYYSFKTDTRVYPEDGKKSFVPVRSDAINFIIYSSKRVSENDKNVINLTVINKTGLTLNTVIDGDDAERPRVNLTKR